MLMAPNTGKRWEKGIEGGGAMNSKLGKTPTHRLMLRRVLKLS